MKLDLGDKILIAILIVVLLLYLCGFWDSLAATEYMPELSLDVVIGYTNEHGQDAFVMCNGFIPCTGLCTCINRCACQLQDVIPIPTPTPTPSPQPTPPAIYEKLHRMYEHLAEHFHAVHLLHLWSIALLAVIVAVLVVLIIAVVWSR